MKNLLNIINTSKISNLGFLLIFILGGCHQSFQTAQTRNSLRHGGANQKVANFIVEVNDYVLAVSTMSDLAEHKAQGKDTYLIAKELHERFDNLRTDLEFISTLKRVALPDALSEDQDQHYQKVYAESEEKFDEAYQLKTEKGLEELKTLLVDQLENPIDEFTQDMSNHYLDEVRISIKKVSSLDS